MADELLGEGGSVGVVLEREEAERDRLLGLLDAEIEHLRREGERPGWTRWALMVGVGWVIWQVLGVVDKGEVVAGDVWLWFIAFWSLSFGAWWAWDNGRGEGKEEGGEGRFRPATEYYWESRGWLVVIAGHCLAVLVLGYLRRDAVWWVLAAWVYVSQGLGLLMCLVSLTMSFSARLVPMRELEEYSGGRFLLAVCSVFGGLSVAVGIGYLLAALGTAAGGRTTEFRLAGLWWAGVYLLQTLMGLGGESPLAASLVVLRRRLVLGDAGLESVRREVDVALAGLGVADVVHGDIQTFLMSVRLSESEMAAAAWSLDAARDAIGAMVRAEGGSGEEQMKAGRVVQAVVDAAQQHVEASGKAWEEASGIAKRLRSRLKRLQAAGADRGVREVMETVRVASERHAERAGEVREKWGLLRKRWEDVRGEGGGLASTE